MVVLVRGDEVVARWPLAGSSRADLGLVDQLARLQVAARRAGCTIVVHDADVHLSRLLHLVGLGGVVPAVAGGLPVEVSGQTEEGEEVRVQEVVVPDDPVA
jgi:hypothetical protein